MGLHDAVSHHDVMHHDVNETQQSFPKDAALYSLMSFIDDLSIAKLVYTLVGAHESVRGFLREDL
jgi:hypothetical protein